MKRKFQSRWNCNSLLVNNLCLSEAGTAKPISGCKPETSQSSRRGPKPRPQRSASSSRSGEGQCGQGRGGAERRAPPRVPERGWYGVWLGPLHGLGSEPGEYVPARSKLHLPIAIPPSGGAGWKMDSAVGRERGMNRLLSWGKKLGPCFSGLKVADVAARSLVAATSSCEQRRGLERNCS